MNEKKRYEQIITGKLDALPLPDLQDAIWARIEAQLDIDLPTDDGGGNTPSSGAPSGPGWIGGAGFLLFVAVLITFFTLKKNNNEQPLTTPVSKPLIQKDSLLNTNAQPPPASRSALPVPVTTNSPINVAVPDRIDTSSKALGVAAPSLQDTSVPISRVPLPDLQPKDTTVTKKRVRGVKGITDDDYRIVPSRKDSS